MYTCASTHPKENMSCSGVALVSSPTSEYVAFNRLDDIDDTSRTTPSCLHVSSDEEDSSFSANAEDAEASWTAVGFKKSQGFSAEEEEEDEEEVEQEEEEEEEEEEDGGGGKEILLSCVASLCCSVRLLFTLLLFTWRFSEGNGRARSS